jgi:ribosomal subunit interface protein
MDIIFRGRHTTVPERFRRHATVKLTKIERLDHKAMRVDVEVSKARNPRQADTRERVELTIRSRGPAIRAEASADDRYTALDLAFAKLESRLRRMSDRRKPRRSDATVRTPEVLAAVAASALPPDGITSRSGAPAPLAAQEALTDDDRRVEGDVDVEGEEQAVDGMVPIQMEGEGPLVVREKAHPAKPITLDQALLEMELVGHDFYLFHDRDCDKFSVVYRRRGYDYGVIRLVEE